MRSSFVRKGAGSAAAAGTRPGLHGQTLVSTGLADWDKLLGGGLPLGTLTLIVEDCHSQQHVNLLRYFLAEAVMTGQKVAWFSTRSLPPDGAAEWLPSHMAADAARGSSKDAAVDGVEGDSELRIAWQYRKYMANAARQEEASSSASSRNSSRTSTSSSNSSAAVGSAKDSAQKALDAGVSRQWCHNYDLSRPMDSAVVQQHGLECRSCDGSFSHAVEQAVAFVGQHSAVAGTTGGFGAPVPSRTPAPVGRVVIQSLLSPSWRGPHVSQAGRISSTQGGCGEGPTESEAAWDSDEQQWRSAAAALYALRQAVQSTRCAVVVTVQADAVPPPWLRRLQHLCHVVMTLHAITDASDVYKLLPDAASAAALLSFERLPSVGMLGPRVPDPQLYVVRHKRRRLAITPVDVDPDAQAKQQAAIATATAGLAQMGMASPGRAAWSGAGGAPAVGRAGGARDGNAARGLDF